MFPAIAIIFDTVFSSLVMSCPFCLDLNGGKTCHSSDSNPYRLYATITTYPTQRTIVPVPSITLDSDCRPVFVNILARHTTRYPEEEQIISMRDNLPRLRKKILEQYNNGKNGLCAEDIQRLRNFIVDTYDIKKAMLPADVGKRDAKALGKIFKMKFPGIFDRDYDPKLYPIEYTIAIRTKTTAGSMAEGLFGDNFKNITTFGHVNQDTLNFFDQCDEYQEKCGVELKDRSEEKKFKNGSVMNALIRSVSKRLGFNVTYDDIYDMYNSCRYGYDLMIDDIWCGVFTKDELQVLEYAEDIKYYWKDGYGNELNRRAACPVAKSFVNSLKDASVSANKIKARIQITHAEELKNILAMMGLFKDDTPLTSDSICSHLKRKWRTGLISTFLSNLVLALYQCPNDRYKVLTLFNERPVVAIGCQSPFCDLDDFVSTYRRFADNCSIKSLCCPCCQ